MKRIYPPTTPVPVAGAPQSSPVRGGCPSRIRDGCRRGGAPGLRGPFPLHGGSAMPGRFGRVLTAMATPFSPDGNLDVDGAQRLARPLLHSGTHTLVVA